MQYCICPNKKLLYYVDSINAEETAAILCSSYEIDEGKLEKIPVRLVLGFDDIRENRSNSFNKTLAKKIRQFTEALPCGITKVYVCCDSGESRSSAICAALMRFDGQNEMQIWKNPHYHPNTLVYKLLCAELGIKVSGIGLKYREYINKKALSDAIKKRGNG